MSQKIFVNVEKSTPRFPTAIQIEVFNGPTVRVNCITFEIGYYLDRRTGHFICTWRDRPNHEHRNYRRQQIVVFASTFFRVIPEVSRKATAGCREVTAEQLVALGFVLHREGGLPHDYVTLPLAIAQ